MQLSKWAFAVLKICHLFLSKKLRSRICIIGSKNTGVQISKIVPLKCLPEDLGGNVLFDPEEWILKAEIKPLLITQNDENVKL